MLVYLFQHHMLKLLPVSLCFGLIIITDIIAGLVLITIAIIILTDIIMVTGMIMEDTEAGASTDGKINY